MSYTCTHCNQTISTKQIQKLQNEIESLKKRENMHLLQLQIYKDIIEQNLKIKVKDTFENVNKECPKIKVFENVNKECPKKEKKPYYRSMKNQLELVPEKELEAKINALKEDTDNDEKKCLQEIDVEFHTIDRKNFRKKLNSIKTLRIHLLKYRGIKGYCKLLEEHFILITQILDGKPGKHSIDFFSSIERRLLRKDYVNTELDVEEIRTFKKEWQSSINVLCQHEPLVIADFLQNFTTHCIALFTIKDCWKTIFYHGAAIYNVIYLPISKSTNEDPYSYYTLEKVEGNNRYWKMDCRLEMLTNEFIDTVKPYCISLFRKIYYDVFHDNTYRSDYVHKAQILEFECQQLLTNILLLSNVKECRNMIRCIIRENATYRPSKNDKFNLYGDDKLQQRRFKNETSYDTKEIVQALFDDIDGESITQICDSFHL